MVKETIDNPSHIQEAASADDTNTGSELVVLENNKPQLGDLQQNDDGKEEEKETTSTAEGLAAAGQSQATSCCTWWVLPPWLFSLRASYAAGVICWGGIAVAVLCIAHSSVFDDGDDDGATSTYAANATATNSTDTTCDADLLDGLALYLLDKKCVAELSCEGQHQIANFMDEFLSPLRVEAIFFTNCFMIFSFMVLQQGGIPATTKDNKEKSRWYLGSFAWLIWVSCVGLQWITTASSAASLVFGYISMEGQYRDCMVELPTGHAILNATLPVMLIHPVLVSQLMAMLGQMHAILTALHTAEFFQVDPRAWLRRYTVGVLGPYFTLVFGYFVCTLSFVFGYVFLLPLFTFSATLTAGVSMVLFKLVMPYLKAKEGEDKEAQEKFAKELKEAGGEGCTGWCNSAWAKLWCINIVQGFPRSCRDQLREVLWWFDAWKDPAYGILEFENLLDRQIAATGPLGVVVFAVFSPLGICMFAQLDDKQDKVKDKSLKTFTDMNDMMSVCTLSFFAITLSPWLIGATWSAFFAYQGQGESMAFVAEFYRHTFAAFTGTVDLSLPAFDLDFTVLWKGTWYDFVEMWDFMALAPDELLEISNALTGASFGFSLGKVLVSWGLSGILSVLKLLPDNWEMVGGRNIPLGASALRTVDAGAFLISMGEDIDVVGFNEAFGEVIKVRDDDGLYEFSVEKAKDKTVHFRFDVAILAQVFGEKLVALGLDGCEGMHGNIDVFKGMQIKELNLKFCNSLEGDIVVFKGMELTSLNLFFCEMLTGNIEAFKDMQIKELNLEYCRKLTGDKEAFKQAHPKCRCRF